MAGLVLGVNQIIMAACNFISFASLELAAPDSAMNLECRSQNKDVWRELLLSAQLLSVQSPLKPIENLHRKYGCCSQGLPFQRSF